MPAIQPARLKKDAAQVANAFGEPQRFFQYLEDFLETYADRIRRPGTAGPPPTLLPTYHVPGPAMRQLLLFLNPMVGEQPDRTWEIVDALWQKPLLEHRLIAIALLSFQPADHEERIVEQILVWLNDIPDEIITKALLVEVINKLSPNAMDGFLTKVDDLVQSKENKQALLGLSILASIAGQLHQNHLPHLFSILAPITRNPKADLRGHLLEIISALAPKNPPETAYFLQQNFLVAENPGTAWLIRQSLRDFPPNIRMNLQQLVKR